MLVNQDVVDLTTMQCEADGLLGAVGDRLAGGLVSGNDDEGDLAGRSLWSFCVEERKVDFLDDAEHGLRLEGRTIKSLLDLGGKAGIEGFGIKPLDDFAVAVANPHWLNLLDKGATGWYPAGHMSGR